MYKYIQVCSTPIRDATVVSQVVDRDPNPKFPDSGKPWKIMGISPKINFFFRLWRALRGWESAPDSFPRRWRHNPDGLKNG